MSVDPLAHKRPGLTPYHYVQNNPLNRFDPDGLFDKDLVWKGTKQVAVNGAIGVGAGLAIAKTGGAAAALLGTSVLVESTTGVIVGGMNIYNGINDKPEVAPNGVFKEFLLTTGLDQKTTNTISYVKSFIQSVYDWAGAAKKGATLLDESVPLIDAVKLTDEVKQDTENANATQNDDKKKEDEEENQE